SVSSRSKASGASSKPIIDDTVTHVFGPICYPCPRSVPFAALRACPKLETWYSNRREQILRYAQDDREEGEGMTERERRAQDDKVARRSQMFDRRMFLKSSGIALVAGGFLPKVFVRMARAATPASRKVVVAVFQRGAVDGL